MKKLRVAIQMDPLPAVKREGDNTLMLAAAVLKRGGAVWHYLPRDLSFHSGAVTAWARPLAWDAQTQDWRIGETPGKLDLARDADVVLMRQNPPFDMSYISATYLLERLRGQTLVVNDPREVRDHPEKLFPLQFPEFLPPTLVSANADDIRAFHREQGEIVLKPLYLFGGHGVAHVNRQGANLGALLDMLLVSGAPLLAQRFLPEVESGERRIVLIDGEFKGAFARIPATGEIRSNVRVGARVAAAEPTPGQREMCEILGPVMREKGLLFAGFDMIGDWLIEINVTSPGGFLELKTLYGAEPETAFWEAVERRL